jgi:flavin reductase (DIM6/NTAB) family NADH-FMN oxidoreductase RutF
MEGLKLNNQYPLMIFSINQSSRSKNLVTTYMEVGVQTPEETLRIKVDLAEILHGY